MVKTGRPGFRIPSAETVSKDVKQVFVRVRTRIANMLQVFLKFPFLTIKNLHLCPQDYDGALNFATDAWTSPNHKAFIAFTVHLEQNGAPFSMLLDLVEVAKLHSGKNLAEAFEKVLKDFGVCDKVSF